MQSQDVVKLIHQNESGGGHYIRDHEACLRYLRQEYDTAEKISPPPLPEDIGNGFVRVMLTAVKADFLKQLGMDFICSSAAFSGSLDSFQKKLAALAALAALAELAQSGIFTFGVEALTRYLDEYKKAGYPMVSHSETYQAAYHPACRVVLRSYLHVA